ncbi:VOC family protein [Teredinibacter turnerae]|uniref:VOC family protein n=1 Tax=Teredinibacter turnerae TaxID=2426 RepID=UPI0030CB4659
MDILQSAPGTRLPDFTGNARPLRQRLHLVLLGVADLARSRAFFANLGWSACASSDDGFVRIDMGGYALGLLSWQHFSKEVFGHQQQPPTGYRGAAFAYLVDTPDAVAECLARAKSAGATIVKPVTRTPWGVNGFFTCPDGHLFEIDFEPHWRFSEDHKLLSAT